MASNVKLGLTKSDLVRSGWAFLLPFVVLYVAGVTGIVQNYVSSCTTSCDLSAAKAAVVALTISVVVSALAALKNGVLADGSKLKG